MWKVEKLWLLVDGDALHDKKVLQDEHATKTAAQAAIARMPMENYGTGSQLVTHKRRRCYVCYQAVEVSA